MIVVIQEVGPYGWYDVLWHQNSNCQTKLKIKGVLLYEQNVINKCSEISVHYFFLVPIVQRANM